MQRRRPSRRPLDKTFTAGGGTPHVVVDVSDVPVTVQTGTAAAVHVPGHRAQVGVPTTPRTARSSPCRPADGVRITASDTSDVHGSFERVLQSTVPPGAQVEIANAGAPSARAGSRAKLVAHVKDGAIHVGNHRGDLDVTTASGAVELVDVQADAIVARTRRRAR